MIKLGYPNPDTLVIVRNLPEKGAAYGYPFADFQGNFLTSIEDPPQPWLKLQMVDSDNSTINMNLIRDNLDALFEVTQEMGPWNELMMSLWFRGIVWLLMIIVIIFGVLIVELDDYGLDNIALLSLYKLFRWSLDYQSEICGLSTGFH